jgi:dTDP-4-amino-4,6-dideoxygalactose transaminase
MTERATPTVCDMASSSKPHVGSSHHIYVSVPQLTQSKQPTLLDDAHVLRSDLSGSGIGAGDVVFVSTFAHERVADVISRCGAEPIILDVTLETWHVSADVLDMTARWCLSIGATPKALLIVDVYGTRCDSDALRDVCWKFDMAVIEDHVERERWAHLERLPAVVARRREIHARYRRGFEGVPGLRFMPVADAVAWNPWLTCLVFEEFDMRDQVLAGLGKEAFDCSLLLRPLHTLPAYAHATAIVDGTAEYLFEHGLCLPNSSTLTDSDVDAVIEMVVAVVG